MTHLMLLYGAGVLSGLNNLYTNYLKPWSVPVGIVCAAAGALIWMLAGAVGSTTHGAVGIRACLYGIAGVFIVASAAAIIAIGTALAA
jgi:hypothetical protein